MCEIKPSSLIVAGLETDKDEVLYNRTDIENTLAIEFRERQRPPSLKTFNVCI